MDYIHNVQSGKLVTCGFTKMAVQRFVDDMAKGQERGLYFNANKAEAVIKFFRLLQHSKGKHRGKAFQLEDWQQFIVANIYGWRIEDPDGPRRFRTSYVEVPRKNGKTTLAAGCGLFAAFIEDEGEPHVYTAATKRDQAKIAFTECKSLIRNSPALRQGIEVYQNKLTIEKLGAFIEPLSADARTLDGLNPHFAVIDELHAHRTSEVVDVIRTATGARTSPHILEITTAGVDKQGVCWDHRSYTEKVLAGTLQDDSWFGMIFTLDEGDDYRNPEVWIKANPNLGVSLHEKIVADAVHEAMNRPTAENSILRYHFNVWTQSVDKWIAAKYWPQNSAVLDEGMLQDLPCYAGLDLASTRDFNALVLLWHNAYTNTFYTRQWFWIPQDRVAERMEHATINWRKWVKARHLNEVPGNVMDNEVLAGSVTQILTKYKAQLAYDRAMAYSGTIQEIVRSGVQTTPQAQSMSALSAPAKELEKAIASGRLQHDGNPVMQWMMDNVMIYADGNDNIKLSKKSSVEKIDGPVALVMAMAEFLDSNVQTKVYTHQGF
jgi:phage terminase large subunit-like protein